MCRCLYCEGDGCRQCQHTGFVSEAESDWQHEMKADGEKAIAEETNEQEDENDGSD